MNTLFFGGTIRFVFEGYLEIGIAVIISILDLEWDKELGYAVAIDNCFTIVFAVVLVWMPLYIWFFYRSNLDILEHNSFKARYGRLLDGLNLNDDDEYNENARTISIIFLLSFVVKRILIIVAAMCLAKWPVF